MPNTQDKILANSRMAAVRSNYIPIIMGTLVASIIFLHHFLTASSMQSVAFFILA